MRSWQSHEYQTCGQWGETALVARQAVCGCTEAQKCAALSQQAAVWGTGCPCNSSHSKQQLLSIQLVRRAPAKRFVFGLRLSAQPCKVVQKLLVRCIFRAPYAACHALAPYPHAVAMRS